MNLPFHPPSLDFGRTSPSHLWVRPVCLFPCTFGLWILFHKAQALSSAALTFFKSASGTMPSRFSNRTDGSEPMALHVGD